jgi:sugar phosphate isomerase/epimerase
VSVGQRYHIHILYEPVDTPRDDITSVSEILARVPDIYLHIDTGHANLFGRKPEEFIEKFHTRLRHVHLNDNDGIRDLHIPMGTGSINWERLIKLLKGYYDGTITLEIFSRDRDYALLSRDKLRKLWEL